MKGAGHGFAGEQGQQAGKALVAWFDKYLSADAAKRGKSSTENAAAAH
jgi:hypothetical protein